MRLFIKERLKVVLLKQNSLVHISSQFVILIIINILVVRPLEHPKFVIFSQFEQFLDLALGKANPDDIFAFPRFEANIILCDLGFLYL